MENGRKKIVILGSTSADIFLEINQLPRLGETIQGEGGYTLCGGKGSNQAAAAAKVGADAVFLGQVGNDPEADVILKNLADTNLDVSKVIKRSDVPSGRAYIMLLPNGDNSIVIVGGSNMKWETDITDEFKETIRKGDYLILQREIPEEVNIIGAKIAREAGKMVVMDAGGMEKPISKEMLNNIDIFSPNETEFERVFNISAKSEEEILTHVRRFQKEFPHLKFLIKLGENGSMYVPPKGDVIRVQACTNIPEGKAIIDTTGAGDCYTGTFVAALAEGKEIKAAMTYASAAALLCICVKGALPSMPWKEEVTAILN
eukprot:CAMPEP_0114994958 /NCGR_PEP_ID=MMETSP0216-20121206/13442_1 /TAXON_ID=223996 /ORGANISM="Protocruzia adherens, Strain Boccale" /LENGTH=315 /DNA_ID=CAMNT_0002358905 /DNA_START=21 /DNA_END=968 /DNA_ORIENTATION=-